MFCLYNFTKFNKINTLHLLYDPDVVTQQVRPWMWPHLLNYSQSNWNVNMTLSYQYENKNSYLTMESLSKKICIGYDPDIVTQQVWPWVWPHLLKIIPSQTGMSTWSKKKEKTKCFISQTIMDKIYWHNKKNQEKYETFRFSSPLSPQYNVV